MEREPESLNNLINAEAQEVYSNVTNDETEEVIVRRNEENDDLARRFIAELAIKSEIKRRLQDYCSNFYRSTIDGDD